MTKEKVKVLIVVKTYPTLSSKYDELVCTAGFREDGRWIRIYPIPFRKLDFDKQYRKYDWLEIEVEKKTDDFRPESFRPSQTDNNFKFVNSIDTRDAWRNRKEIVLKNVYTNLKKLIAEAYDKNLNTSLAVFKPKRILKFIIESVERDWNEDKLKKVEAHAAQYNLFETPDSNPFKVVKKLPYKFSYQFEDEEGKKSTLMIEDWEIGQLYWNSVKRHQGNERLACQDVRKKYEDEFIKTKDLYLYLGTTYEFHKKNAPNPFVIIGVFYPPFNPPQMSLFNPNN